MGIDGLLTTDAAERREYSKNHELTSLKVLKEKQWNDKTAWNMNNE